MATRRSWAARILPVAAIGSAIGVAAVAGSFVAVGWSPEYLVAPVEQYLGRIVPGPVVTAAILVLGDLGQRLNLAVASGVTAMVFGVVGITARTAGRSLEMRIGSVSGPIVALPITFLGGVAIGVLLTGSLRSAVGAAAGATVGLAVVTLVGSTDPVSAPDRCRRRVLLGLGSVGVLGIAGYALGRRRSNAASFPQGERTTDDAVEEANVLLADARDRSIDLDGLEPLVSEEFFEVDINAVNPDVDRSTWSLSVTGAVDRELSLDFEAVRSLPSREEFVTLRCVGDTLNGNKMDTALWTVSDIEPLLEAAGASSTCCVMLRAADGYFEEFPMEALRRGMLAYRMNGRQLPRRHGYPVRALIPGHWGEVNVKWLTEIEVLDEPAVGVWESRGWHGTGPVNSVAKLHAVNRASDGDCDGDTVTVTVGGHAYAGTRGVSAVEVSIDGGDSWAEATLSTSLPGDDVWRQWTHQYEWPRERHSVTARVIEADGTVQPRERTDPYPSGASGWVTETIAP